MKPFFALLILSTGLIGVLAGSQNSAGQYGRRAASPVAFGLALGGWKDLNVKEKATLDVVESIMDELQDTLNDVRGQKTVYRLLNIHSARRQVTATTNYEVVISYDKTTCPPKHPRFHNPKVCQRTSGTGARCTMKFFERVWTDTAKLTGMACVNLDTPVFRPSRN